VVKIHQLLHNTYNNVLSYLLSYAHETENVTPNSTSYDFGTPRKNYDVKNNRYCLVNSITDPQN